MKHFITLLTFLATALGVNAQIVHVYSKNGGRTDFAEGEVLSIEFAEQPKLPLTAPADVQMVDLGLSVRWASCNVGATEAHDSGAYFAWGELSEKQSYTWAEYFDAECELPLNSICGMPDYDVATAEWGGTWRLPSLAEVQELCDRCEWTWTEQNGQHGCLVKGPSGEEIFLPAGGTRQGMQLYLGGSYGSFLTGSADIDNKYYARCLVFYADGSCWIDANLRDYGQSVRPVCK